LFETELNWTRFRSPTDTDQNPEIAPLKLPIHWRSTYSCVTPEISALLSKYDRVYVAGVFTDASVYSTVVDIFDAGTPVTVIKDCVATLHGEQVHTYALRALEHIIDRKNVVYSDELPAGLLAEQST
jgi:nicotinamidase-related amidase